MNDGDLLLKEHGQKPSLASWPFVIMIVVSAFGIAQGADWLVPTYQFTSNRPLNWERAW